MVELNAALSKLLADAARLCDHQAASETVLGYLASAATYTEMADDARKNKWWVARQPARPPVRRR